MKIKQFSLDTTTTGAVTPWHFLDWRQNPFAVSFSIDQSGTAAHVVEYGYSNLVAKDAVATNSTTTTTITLPNHGLITGDSVIISRAWWANGTNADTEATTRNGTFAATRVDANSFTITGTTNDGTAFKYPLQVMIVKTMVHDSYSSPATANSDGNLAFSVQACRVRVTTGGAGWLTFNVSQGSN